MSSPVAAGGLRSNAGEAAAAANGHGGGCACGFPICACTGRGGAAVASAASSADMDIELADAAAAAAAGGKEESWVAVDLSDSFGGGSAGDDERRPVFRTEKIPGILLHPYRVLIVVRLVAFILFVLWRIEHKNPDAMWLWGTSIVGEFWFGFSWLLDQLPKLNPINRTPDLAALRRRFDHPDGSSSLPALDVFVTTADPFKEPILSTANSVLSILAADYPVDRSTCYLSDDSGMLLTFEAMAEAAKFATLWVPFCRKHAIEPRGPESYFELKAHPYMGTAHEDFVADRRRVRREYDEFKVRINALSTDIRQRSDTYNAAANADAAKATWMADGTQWAGTWIDPADGHRRGDHAGIVQVLLDQPSRSPQAGPAASLENPLDLSRVDVRLPMLVYVSREKRPGHNHQKKAGAMNALTRASAVLSNSPFILNLDCDHYINNSQALRAGVCFMLGRDSDTVAFVQFPQRFEGVDPTDLYANHNRIFFDGTLRALDGLQGPIYVGTGCLFRRVTLYGFDPPRINTGGPCLPALAGLFPRRKQQRYVRAQEAAVPKGKHGFLPMPKKRYGKSELFADSIPMASHPPSASCTGEQLARPRTDEEAVAEAVEVASAAYEQRTGWGSDIGWVYGTVTEDVVTGYRMHIRGWRSRYCSIYPHAFIGTAPINLTERLFQVLRWSTGSLEIFFSRNNPLLGSTYLHPLQRVAYINITTYPFTALFLIFYTSVPALSFVTGHFIVQKPTLVFYIYLAIVLGTLLLLAVLEVKWAGVTVFEWFRNGQFWMTASCSAYLAAVLQVVTKVVFRRDISFKLTSKQAAGDEKKDKFADLYVVRWTWLMVPPICIIMVNLVGSAVAFAKVLDGEWTHWGKVAGGVFFNFWVLFHLYPFAKGILGKLGKTPLVVLLWWAFTFVLTAVLYINIPHPHGPRPRTPPHHPPPHPLPHHRHLLLLPPFH